MINIDKNKIKDFLIKDKPKEIYNFCKLNQQEYNIEFNSIFKNISTFIVNNIYNSQKKDLLNDVIKFIEHNSLSIIFLGLIFNTFSFSINTYIFFFIINSGFFSTINDNCFISYLLSIIYPPFSILLFKKYSELDKLNHLPSDVFESKIIVKDLSYYCVISSVLPTIISDKILVMMLIKIFCETYFGPFKRKMELDWIDNEKISNLILGSNYEKNINILQLDKLVFLRKVINSHFSNLFVCVSLILPFMLPILMTVNALFFNFGLFNLFMFHILIFLGSGICFYENIFIAFASIFLFNKFNILDTLFCYLYIIYNFNSDTQKIPLGWLDTTFYTRYQIVLKTDDNKNILINCKSGKDFKSSKFLYQHRYLRYYDNLRHISVLENGHTTNIELLNKINNFQDYNFKNENEAKKKLIDFHNKNSQSLFKNENLLDLIKEIELTNNPIVINHFYDNINKDILNSTYDNLYYLHELNRQNIVIKEIHFHIDKGCFVYNLNKFITYKTGVIKQNIENYSIDLN